MLTRRELLAALSAGSAALTAARVWPSPGGRARAQEPQSKDQLIVRSSRPQDLETPAHLLTSWITPVSLFYVRSHFYTPAIDASSWRLLVDGEVDRVLELSLDELSRLPSVTIPVTLECAGNGRAFFDPPVAGVQWAKGAVGTARWTGVRLADLLRAAGVRPSARYLWLDGADRGIGRAPDFVRSVPIEKALQRETIVAYGMNGEPLPEAHGFPLRAIVPGWEGAYSVKWLTHLRASDRDHDGPFVQTAYRYPRYPVRPGAVPVPADMEPVRGLPVKSLITSPAAGSTVAPGAPVRIAGFAWAGETEVAQVDVSTDNGRTWTEAELGGERAPYAWRAFEYLWRPDQPGSRALLSRATDARGVRQPIVAVWNPGGYLWNAVDQVRVDVADAIAVPPERGRLPAAPVPDHPGAAVMEMRCTGCHDQRLIEQQRLTAEGWGREVDKMVGWGASVTDAERQRLLEFLASRWSP